MSTLESVIWHILGYLAMPTVFVIGFIGVALISMGVLRVLGHGAASKDGGDHERG